MNYDHDMYKKALSLFFELLQKKSISETDENFLEYKDDEMINILEMIAEQSGTRIVLTNQRIQIISKGKGSPFATNFTHLKSKYTKVENKEEFHLISIIILAFIANVDNEEGLRQNSRGMTFFAIEEAVNKLFKDWKTKTLKGNDESEEYGIEMKKMVNKWSNIEVKNESKRKTTRVPLDTKSRIGFINTAMTLLKNEGLIYIADIEDVAPRAIPKYELFDRLEHVYHHQHRYQEIKGLIEETEGVVGNA